MCVAGGEYNYIMHGLSVCMNERVFMRAPVGTIVLSTNELKRLALFYFFQGTNKLSRKNCPKSPHCTAKFIALSPDPSPIPSLAVLQTEKQAFQCAALQSWELCLGIWLHA